MRTTSSLEALNSTLGRSFPKHPHIFKFINRLKLFEFSKSVNMLHSIRNDVPDEQLKRRRQCDQNRQEKIKFFTDQLRANDQMTPELFLDAMENKEILPGTGKT